MPLHDRKMFLKKDVHNILLRKKKKMNKVIRTLKKKKKALVREAPASLVVAFQASTDGIRGFSEVGLLMAMGIMGAQTKRAQLVALNCPSPRCFNPRCFNHCNDQPGQYLRRLDLQRNVEIVNGT